MARVRFAWLASIVLILSLLAPLPAAAQGATERQRQVVYNGQIFDGQGYTGQFYPRNERAIYLLAGVQNVLIPKITDVYWWPITREYKADWESTNEPLTGTLELGDLTFPMTVYSLRYDGGYEAAKTGLLVGGAAVQAYAAYQQARDDYQAALDLYLQQQEEFNRQLALWGEEVDRRRAEGLSIDDVPVPKEPQAPAQITVTVTEPEPGIAFSLPAGEYPMRLRGPDGQVVPGSERKVVAFGARREGVAYKVIAASKWTLPDTSTGPNDIIFVSGETALYIQPAAEREYDAFYAAKLLNSQQRSVQDRRGVWSWLPTGPFSGSTLSLSIAGGQPRPVHEGTYYAKQNPGAALGYEIVPYDESAGEGVSTFDAFEVRPHAGSTGRMMTVSAPGVPGSTREIRVVRTGMGNVLLALALVPLTGGLSWVFYRRRVLRAPTR
ncbi:MAG: hypothetical protein ACRDIB_16765 [Ardenticatenaceae bacterium]